ncbi:MULTISPECIES: EAL domain-containing protein [Pseudomonas]|uniref:EAL domain-containing protein n=1 Tax=Pseudomonas TaxID=286 RepID=UPI0018E6E63B|nr:MULTISPECIES: EAL domain-containing protein [Pseudomonas]MBJ2260372.1 EAL domain-containing protein [Pseudomonas sp. MF6787]MBU4627812.1 EAL domain-containing protein [Pseudomonas sp. BF61]MDI3205494.1 EAL domain-containing protein [Pseudomonas shahriarae]QYM66260.1 EAL domain-containing protein [Pseudomonas sp. So3.2b]WLH59824.1 EAL domain-containing protein [Pseudomonas sp. FP2294]
MKAIKRVLKRGRSVERSWANSISSMWSQVAVAQVALWLIVALLMVWASLYSVEHLAQMYVFERLSNIVDLSNGNFSGFEPGMLSELKAMGNYEASVEEWPSLLAKSYAFIEYCILLSMSAAGVCTIIGLYKVFSSIYTYYFSMQARFCRGLVNGELSVHYQPIVNMNTGLWVGAEALLRWTHKGQTISPAVFIPLIERSGIMPLTTRWICQRVIEDYSCLLWACDGFYININLSSQDVSDPTFPAFIQQLLSQYGIPASRIVFEVTEGVVLDKYEAILHLNQLRAQGHKIALDDFGTGYSNLSYLDCLPLDILKIDRCFVSKKGQGRANTILVHLLNMARHLKLNVIVEGVETPEQVERLLTLGATTAQGWFYAKDLTAEDLVHGYFSLVHPDMNRVI